MSADVKTHVITVAELLAVEPLSDDETINLVRNTREKILQKQLQNGIPTASDEFEALHKNLVELDKSAYTNKRLKVDSDNSKNLAELAKATAEALFAKTRGGKELFTAPEPIGQIPNPIAEIAGTAKEVPGELTVGDDTRTYDQFMDGSGKIIQERIRNGEISLKDI